MRLSTKVYQSKKEAVKNDFGLTEKEYVDLIKDDYHKGAGMVSSQHMMNLLVSVNKAKVIDRGVLDDWDFVWFYKRNLHIVLPQIEGYVFDVDGINCSVLDRLDKDLEIDTVLPTMTGPKVSYIRLIKRNIPVSFKNSDCNYTVEVIHEDMSKLRFHFAASQSVRKVFIEGTKYCVNCDKCRRVKSTDGWDHVIRSRFKDGCGIADLCSEPFGILTIILNVVDIYVNRKKISKGKKTSADGAERAIMVAKQSEDTDTERLLPMIDYVTNEYHESVRQEWKGGHHASPVSHPRSGYWRKSNHGTHVLVDGEFVEVGKGLGKFIYVKPTLVNAGKDSTLAEMI